MLLLPRAPEEKDEGHMPPSSQLPLKRQRGYSYLCHALRHAGTGQGRAGRPGRQRREDEARYLHGGIALPLKRMYLEVPQVGEGLQTAEGRGRVLRTG